MKRRCQICGRMLGLLSSGKVPGHYVKSQPCPGAHALPIEQDDAFLVAQIETLRERERALALKIRRLIESRANWIDPRLHSLQAEIRATIARLTRRLNRHRAWPARFQREMETRGWGTPPPPYLLERAA